jgi:hypothetical protein
LGIVTSTGISSAGLPQASVSAIAFVSRLALQSATSVLANDVALDYFRRLGHDNHHRLFQVYGWEEKKTQTSSGGNSVDHEKLAEARIHAMTAADLNCFLVTCALVSDLYCPGYSSAETVSKESNLMRTAVRYEVDASKVTAEVKVELSKKRKGGKVQRRNVQKEAGSGRRNRTRSA